MNISLQYIMYNWIQNIFFSQCFTAYFIILMITKKAYFFHNADENYTGILPRDSLYISYYQSNVTITHCGPMTSCGVIEHGQHWLRWYLTIVNWTTTNKLRWHWNQNEIFYWRRCILYCRLENDQEVLGPIFHLLFLSSTRQRWHTVPRLISNMTCQFKISDCRFGSMKIG